MFRDERAFGGWEKARSSRTGTKTSGSDRQDCLVCRSVTRTSAWGIPHTAAHSWSGFLLRWWLLPAEQSIPDRLLLISSSVLLWLLTAGRIPCCSILEASWGLCLQDLLSVPRWDKLSETQIQGLVICGFPVPGASQQSIV